MRVGPEHRVGAVLSAELAARCGFQELRRTHPVTKVTSPLGVDVWLITRYDDARAALTEPLLSKDSARFAEILRGNGLSGNGHMPFSDSLRTHMLQLRPCGCQKVGARHATC